MVKRMLIDANHPEETRAVVLDDHHLVDFDFETSTKLQIKGNIYLAKVTRVEPSLQAAFVEYGGNRHGFLAFSEIHPDYFQVPQADRALLEEHEREESSRGLGGEPDADGEGHAETVTTDADEETADVVAEQARRRARLLRSYKIQEVVKRRQIMLVQVVKEERGNKGAALTTYLSLAGRYCVLMPNTPRGGGISRKIVQPEDRRKLKQIAQELEVPTGMGLIIRTAGQERNKSEIKRDYEYLLRLWNEIRETTLQSIAPKLIYEEGDLIKRALRDLYTRDIEEVLVEGEEGYRSAKRLMQMLMPSRARLVRQYKEEEEPLFFHFRVEDQLDAMHSPTVELPSGGSIVIHTTEALIAIDVNSGRSTRERHIDETAVKTNLEAADEVARQLRLRDLAGLIVIDFIDMAEGRHQRAVEKRLRDALKFDRARIQMGKISQFGLMELSRQRLRASLQELSSQICPHCAGLGVVRSTESCALQALRAIQEEAIQREAALLRITLPGEVALYVLNQKRESLMRLEQRYGMQVIVQVDSELVPPSMRIEVLERRERVEAKPEAAKPEPAKPEPARLEPAEPAEPEVAEVRAPAPRAPAAPVQAATAAEAAPAAEENGEEANARRRRKRRRRRRRSGEPGLPAEAAAAATLDVGEELFDDAEDEAEGGEEPELVAEAGQLLPEAEGLPVIAADVLPPPVAVATDEPADRHEPEPDLAPPADQVVAVETVAEIVPEPAAAIEPPAEPEPPVAELPIAQPPVVQPPVVQPPEAQAPVPEPEAGEAVLPLLPDAPIAAGEAKPKRRRSSTKAATTATTSSSTGAATTPRKPRAPRAKKAAAAEAAPAAEVATPAVAEPVAAPEPTPEAASPPVAEAPAPAEPTPAVGSWELERQHDEPQASEPSAVEPMVPVAEAPATAPAEEHGDGESEPPRRGWWDRWAR